MSLAALGCNPTLTGPSLEDIGGVTLGTIAYSPDSGIYIAVRANQAITRYDLCSIIRSNFDIDQASGALEAGITLCIPQVAMANDEYGWALVFGRGLVRASAAAIVAADSGSASISGTAGQVADASDTDAVGGLLLDVDAGNTVRNVGCFAMWPKKVN